MNNNSYIESKVVFLPANNAWCYVWHDQIVPVLLKDSFEERRFWEHRADLVGTLEYRGLIVLSSGNVMSNTPPPLN